MLQHYLSAKPKPWIEDVLWNKTAGADDVQLTAFRYTVVGGYGRSIILFDGGLE